MKVTIPLKRLVPALIIGPATWLGPYIAAVSIFLPALIQHIDAENKVELVALFSTCAMILGAVSNILAGYLSDRTYSRWGRRAPWILGGAFVFMISMCMASTANSIGFLLFSWSLAQVALNFIVAPMVAWLDLAKESEKGTASGAYGGLGMALGNNGFTIVGAMFLGQFRLGFIIFGIITLIGSIIAVLLVKEPSNLEDKNRDKQPEQPKEGKPKISLSFFPKWSHGRDYYLALLGKLFQGIGNFAITGYLLFIMTDFMGKNQSDTQGAIQIINSIMLIFGIAMGFIAGPISDKFNILKLPVGLSTIFLGLGALGMYFFPNNIGVVLYGFAAGLGMGIWNSLDNLLNLKVIPDKNRVAFFLGIYNLGNTLTQAIAPIIAALIISLYGYSGVFIVSFLFSMTGGILILCIKSVRK